MLFGGKKSPDKTILVLDVENGSVGSALVRISGTEQPKIFGETRIMVPLGMSRNGQRMQDDIEVAAREALRNASEVAARIRTHEAVSTLGAIEHAAVFLSPPWGRPDLAAGKPEFFEPMQRSLAREIARSLGYIPSSFYTGAGAAAFGTRALLTQEPCLVCVVTGEVSELMRMDEDGVAAHATIPTGGHALLRTLMSHGGFSEHEARSAARLPFETAHVREPFLAAAGHFASHVADAARELLAGKSVARVFVLSHESDSEWFARALAEDRSLAELFPDGGEIRALRPRHLTAHIAAHSPQPDVRLCLNALFVDSKFNTNG